MIDCINTNIYLNINNVISIISFRIFSKKGTHQSMFSLRIPSNIAKSLFHPYHPYHRANRINRFITPFPWRGNYNPVSILAHSLPTITFSSDPQHGQKASPLSETNSTNDRDRNGCGVSTDIKRQLRGFRYSSWSCGLRRRHRSRKRGERSGYYVACTRIPEVI